MLIRAIYVFVLVIGIFLLFPLCALFGLPVCLDYSLEDATAKYTILVASAILLSLCALTLYFFARHPLGVSTKGSKIFTISLIIIPCVIVALLFLVNIIYSF